MSHSDANNDNPQGEVLRKGSLLRTMKAVAWSLIGLRKDSEYRNDLERINPLHIIAVGLIAIFALVAFLIVAVKLIV